MAFDNSFTAVTGATYTAAQYNTHVKGNFTSIWVGTTAGDLDYYTSATAKARLAIGAAGGLLRSTGSAPAWLAVGTNGQILTSNGTNPVWSTPSSIKFAAVGHSTDFSHTSGVISWNTDILDPSNWHSTSSNTSRITVSETGTCIAGCTLRHFESGGGSTQNNEVYFALNGSAISHTLRMFSHTADNVSKSVSHVSRPFSVTSGQYVEMGVVFNGGSRTVIAADTCFWVIKIA